ncbi:MAG: [FeFe] hydrogenase H-cluster radical SAM maturase HydE [Polyangiaceae bacterium]|nr:[FeFe] hydrogenase H-cluster radical SAM maturase HydE [Polyangiaceae bacterium]
MERTEIIRWLRERNPGRLAELWAAADRVRHDHVGDQIYLRGLVEVSSYCRRNCAYCGIRAGNFRVERFRLTADEVLDCAARVADFGCGTVVLQGGEDPKLTVDLVASLVRRIKTEFGLAVTLSFGERPLADFHVLRAAGADRYLLRFETSNPEVYARLHPPHIAGELPRRELLRELHAAGFEVGSGSMIGLPGTSYDDVANDLLDFRELDLDMIGVGPYIPHPETPLGSHPRPLPPNEQVPNDWLTTCTVVALTRLFCPATNIPATTALATLRPDGRELGFRCGANVWMPNFTPPRYRASYEIYPGKAAPTHAELRLHDISEILARLGRTLGRGPGPSPHYLTRSVTANTRASCSECPTSSVATPSIS